MKVYQILAYYHKWAYQVLFQTLDQVSGKDYFADCALAFKSIHGTLNHLYFGDKIWFHRFTNQSHHFQSVFDSSFDQYHEGKGMILTQCGQWIDFVNQLEFPLPEMISTKNFSNKLRITPYLATLHHVFNHATHHRGQISAALTQLHFDPPEMDLLYYLNENPSF